PARPWAPHTDVTVTTQGSSMECDINTFADLSFPQKLWLMAESDQFEMVWWAYGGNCIVIDKEEFEAEVLGMRGPLRAFRTEKMSSFIRQLNLYGFNKIIHACRRPPFVPEFLTEQEALVACRKLLFYCNPYFRRDYPHLLKHCKRRVAPKRGALAAPASQQGLNENYQCGSPSAWAMQGAAAEPRDSSTHGALTTQAPEERHHLSQCCCTLPDCAAAAGRRKCQSLIPSLLPTSNSQVLGATSPASTAPGFTQLAQHWRSLPCSHKQHSGRTFGPS
uniref:HSF-type DNA-binding domain-containing protein n=1 Tax=Pavo cristatus TaxID=9049 RepID=A0A8C9L2H2_PAVCR